MLSKRSIKIISIAIMVVMLLAMIGSTVFGIEITEKPYKPTGEVGSIVGTVLGIIKYIGLITAVVIAMFIGIKYITSSPEGKAEVKKTAMFYVAGIVILLSAVAIVTAIENTLGQ